MHDPLIDACKLASDRLADAINELGAPYGLPPLVAFDCGECLGHFHQKVIDGLLVCPSCGYCNEVPGRAADTTSPCENTSVAGEVA